MTSDDLEALLAEQVAYYRACAAEYDTNSPCPHDHASRKTLLAAIAAFAPRGRVLELACGTGQWTTALAGYASELTAIDSSPEMLAIAPARLQGKHVRFLQADIFNWRPDRRYDVVFFSAWLSHVPPQLFARFWALVDECLDDGGRVFFIDELPAVAAQEQAIIGAPAPAVERQLTSGARYRAVKVFYGPDELRKRLGELGWEVAIEAVGWRFFYGVGGRAGI